VSPIDRAAIEAFLVRLGDRLDEPGELVLLGGGALLLLGSPRTTIDIDYVGDDLSRSDFQVAVEQVAEELGLVVDPVPIWDFVPMPANSAKRRVHVGRFGAVDVFALDPYVMALSKLDRGFDSDLADIVFLVQRGLVSLDRIAEQVAAAIPNAAAFDMDPAAMRKHLAVVRRRISAR
jgi:hypothetical protein